MGLPPGQRSVRKKFRARRKAPAVSTHSSDVAAALGKQAEDYAAKYAASLGWRLLGRNVKNRYGELDIVAVDNKEQELVVIEVRCRTLGEVQSPVDSVGPRKLNTLLKAGQAFIEKEQWTGFWRIDLIALTTSPSGDI
ncbi:MAG: YraN family protein, partial [Fretibacterium sp.]|nr:YraN family protein [Fretibacterium sp.]